MHLFGLTGGIASGKSTVAARFRERGVPVLDADAIAREVVLPGSSGLAAIKERFGADVLAPDGSLDRKRLGALVFADAEARRALNAITHPRIAARTQERRQELEDAGHPLACYEAALLVENGLAAAFRPLVVVVASPSVQQARIAARDGLDAEAIAQRLAAQAPIEAKRAAADHVVVNEGSLDALRSAADRVLDAICATLNVRLDP